MTHNVSDGETIAILLVLTLSHFWVLMYFRVS